MSESKLTSVLPNNSIYDAMPGRPISSVYASNDNLKKVLELVQYNNDVEMSFSSTAFGATNTFRFPRAYQFLKNISMVVDLKILSGANTGGVFKEDYMAYHMIKEVKWSIGGTEQLTQRGESFMHIVMPQCESQEKKDKLLDLAGYAANGASLARLTAITPLYGDNTIRLVAILPLPWSSVETKVQGNQQYPLPLHMLNEPLELQVTFREANEVATNFTIDKAVLNFEYAKIGVISSLKSTVYRYPFVSNFSFAYDTGTNTDSRNKVSIDLNSFRKGELRGISFTYVTNANFAANKYYSGSRVDNIALTFNGQIIWKSPKNEIYELIYGKTQNILGYKKIIQTAAGSAQYATTDGEKLIDGAYSRQFTPYDPDDYVVQRGYAIEKNNGIGGSQTGGIYGEKMYYYIPLSEFKDLSQNFSLGVDASKQTMNLSFQRGDASAGKVFVTYHYSALYQFTGDNAVLVF